MAKVSIDEGELMMALESNDGMTSWYLDCQTGQVIEVSDEWDPLVDLDDDEGEDRDEDDEDAFRRAIEEDEVDRYRCIDPIGSHEGFRMMERFASSVEDDRVRNELFDALERHRPFRSFKDALLAFPDVRQRWFAYHEERMREHAQDWLRSEGIDAELTNPSPAD